MNDQSYLDRKYFIDANVYNCPFCNRNNVQYWLRLVWDFDWSEEKKCYVYFVRCTSCQSESMHLSYEKLSHAVHGQVGLLKFIPDVDLDSAIFYSVPTSFFVIDSRIPKIIRELITE